MPPRPVRPHAFKTSTPALMDVWHSGNKMTVVSSSGSRTTVTKTALSYVPAPATSSGPASLGGPVSKPPDRIVDNKNTDAGTPPSGLGVGGTGIGAPVTVTSSPVSAVLSSTTPASPPPAAVPNPAGAIAATVLVGALTVGAGLATIGSIASIPVTGPWGIAGALIFGSATVVGVAATSEMVIYDVNAGPKASPEQSFEAGGSGAIVQAAEEIVNFLSELF